MFDTMDQSLETMLSAKTVSKKENLIDKGFHSILFILTRKNARNICWFKLLKNLYLPHSLSLY